MLRAVEAPDASGEVINVATNSRISLNQLFAVLKKLTGSSLTPAYGSPRAGDVRDSQADISKALRLLGYQPQVSFEEGLKHTLSWVETQPHP